MLSTENNNCIPPTRAKLVNLVASLLHIGVPIVDGLLVNYDLPISCQNISEDRTTMEETCILQASKFSVLGGSTYSTQVQQGCSQLWIPISIVVGCKSGGAIEVDTATAEPILETIRPKVEALSIQTVQSTYSKCSDSMLRCTYLLLSNYIIL